MKKTLALILVAALAACLLAGCGGSASTAPVSSEDTASSAVSEQTSSIVADTATFTRGVWTNNVWHSDFAGLTFNNPEGWTIASDKDIADAMGMGADMLDPGGKFINTELAAMTSVYDMLTADPANGNNVQVMFENLKLEGAAGLTGDAYCEIVKTQLESLEEIDYTVTLNGNTAIAGTTYTFMETSTVYSGVTLKQYYYVRPVGDYMVGIIVTVMDGTSIDEIVANFVA